MVTLGFLNGECADNCIYSDGGPQFKLKYPRKLIDGIIESVCNTSKYQDDNVQLQTIQTLLSIMTCFTCTVHERSLIETFRAIYYIHLSTKSLVNYSTSKAALNQIVQIVYQKVDDSYVQSNL